jgi:hypothetical protein
VDERIKGVLTALHRRINSTYVRTFTMHSYKVYNLLTHWTSVVAQIDAA